MDTLTASSLKVAVENQIHKDRGFWSPTPKYALLRRPELSYFRFPKCVHHRFALSSSVHRKISVLAVASTPASSAPEDQMIVENQEIQLKGATQSKTVHVKFQLQKECSFGQQFHIVGDDPMFGMWDPSDAVPLNWSDGHVWSVELDLPCDKVIKYKFILKGGSDDIYWQPGPDRVFQTWETTKILTVCEDWEDAQLQTIIEESVDQLTKSHDKTEIEILEDLLHQPGEDHVACVNNNMNCYTETEKPFATVPLGDNQKLHVDPNGMSTVRISNNTNAHTKDGQNVHSGDGVPLLVPGLTPMAMNEEASLKVVNEDRAKKFSVSEMNLEEESDVSTSVPQEETVKEEMHEVVNSVLEKDFQWSWRTFQHVLTTLGLF